MSVSPVSVAVIDKKTITKAEVLRAGKDGKAVKIQAIANGKYLLTHSNDGVAPENITVKRVGKNLLVMLEGADASKPDLIIEDFFAKSGTLVGKAEDGELHAYVATDGNADHEAVALADGETSALALGEGSVDDNAGYVLASGFEWSPALIALGGLAAIAAAAGLGYVVAKDHYQDKDSGQQQGAGGGDSGGDDLHVPVIAEVVDNVGDVTGPIANGGATDDTTPTFNGTGTPGNTIEIRDGETLIGEVLVGSDGSWSFTPDKALSAGSHSITTRERNANGVVSEPSDPWEFTIDLTAPAKGTIGGVFDDTAEPAKAISNGGLTKDNTPTLTGKAEAGSTVQVWDNGKLLGTTKADKDGNWKFTTPELVDGKHDLSIVVVDPVGNKSLPSDAFIIDVDTIAPENSGIGKIIDSDGNLIDDGSATKDPHPTLEGSGENGEVVIIIDNGKVIGSTVVEGGKWTFTPDKPLDSGRHELEVVVRDPAGNESAPSDKVIIDLEGANPPVDPEPIDHLPDPDVPLAGTIDTIFKDNNDAGIRYPIENGGDVNDQTIIITGTGVPGDLITIYLLGKEGNSYIFSTTIGADGKWEFTTPELAEDNYDMRGVFSHDGVVTGKTDIFNVTVDVTPPDQPEVGIEGLFGALSLNDLLAAEGHALFAEESNSAEGQDIKTSLLNGLEFNESVNMLTQQGVAINDSISEPLSGVHYDVQDI